jgi:hypothetical protein
MVIFGAPLKAIDVGIFIHMIEQLDAVIQNQPENLQYEKCPHNS